MSNRTIERRMARTLYDEFARKWHREKRLAGKAGQPGFRKPSFKQWHDMHMRDQKMMRESTPIDVQEYLGRDPWGSEAEGMETSSVASEEMLQPFRDALAASIEAPFVPSVAD